MKQRASFTVLATDRKLYSNTLLGRSESLKRSISSLRPTLVGSSCSKFAPPSNLSLKRVKPEPWQRLFEGRNQQDVSTKKHQVNTNTVINEDLINVLNEHSVFDESSQGSFVPTPIQTHIDQLYEQIDDLISQLVEERIRYKQTRIKTEETCSNQLKDQERQFQERTQQTLLDHQKELHEQEKKYFTMLNDEQIESFQREQQLRNELTFIKTSFHTYKVDLEKANSKQLRMKMKETSFEEINQRIHDALVKERKLLNERETTEIENIRKQHQNEITTMEKALADAVVDREHLKSLKKTLRSTKLELNITKEQAMNLSTRLKDLESEHIQTIQEFYDYRMRFNEQTKKMKKHDTESIDQLDE